MSKPTDGPTLLQLIWACTLMIFGFGIGWMGGRDIGEKDCRAQAIKAGVGFWEANPSGGDPRFVFGVKNGGSSR